MITSTANQQIKNIIKLQNKTKARNEQGVFIVEGIKMFEEAKLYNKQNIIKAYVSDSFFTDIMDDGYFEEIPYEVVDDYIFTEASQTVTPQGILAVLKQPCYTLEDIIIRDNVHLLMLEDIRDPGNLGTIIRTAEAAGISGVILSRGCVDIFNPKVIRSTMGSVYRVPFIYVDDFISTLHVLKCNNIISIATHLDAIDEYDAVDYSGKNAVLIGNEANGLSEEAAKLCDIKVKIPMHGQVESLNAAIAAALIMYQVERTLRL